MHPAWGLPQETLRLHLGASSRTASVVDPAFGVIDSLQRYPPDLQAEALFAASVVIAGALGADPHDLVSRAKRQMEEVLRLETNALIISEYAKGELVK